MSILNPHSHAAYLRRQATLLEKNLKGMKDSRAQKISAVAKSMRTRANHIDPKTKGRR